jgi:voltage-gated potassium channel
MTADTRVATVPVLRRAPTERELIADRIARRLDRPVGLLGVVALALWLLEPFVVHRHGLNLLLDLVWSLIAVTFVAEFVARVVVAPRTWPFLRIHWWEVALIVLPFLRFTRALRSARAGRGVASATQSSRRASQHLQSRLTLLMISTAAVAISAGRVLWEYGGYGHSYARAVHDAAMTTLTGSSLGSANGFAQVPEIFLAAYSAVIIATVAGSLGAYFLQSHAERVATRHASAPQGDV